MRENSGNGKGTNGSKDPTLEENAGTRPAGSGGTPGFGGDTFEVAADHEPKDGKLSPSARGRGEAGPDTDAPNIQ